MEQETKNKPEQHNIQVTERFISLERIIAGKNRHLLKIIPRFLMSWFKRLIHLDEINDIIYRYRDVRGADFATQVLDKEFGIKIKVINPENIPLTGRKIVISNHPLGGADGMALISEIGKLRTDILFPVNDILCTLPSLKPVFIPINKYGRNTGNHDAFDKAFESDNCILFFPAGTESKRQKDGDIKDLRWKKTFIKKSIQYKRDIIPAYTEGRNSKFFYKFASIRKKFGIKFNLEMIFLPAELFKQKGKNLTITFGKPIPYQTFDRSRTHQEWADLLNEYVYSLKSNPNNVFVHSSIKTNE